MLCLHIEPSMSQHHTHSTCVDKVKSTKGTRHKNFNYIPTCHHCGISGPNCFQIRSQKPWDKLHVPRKDEPGIENLVKNFMGMEVSPRSLEKGLSIFQDWEHLKKPYMWKDSRKTSSASVNFVTTTKLFNSPRRNAISLTVVGSG
jgi:hypothetical protein